MTLSQLQAFAAVARLGSVTAAARELGVSVPAVSAAVAALRKELGDELMTRTGHGVALTEGGARMAAAAVEILGIADQARRSVAEARGGRRLLRIGATHEIAEYAAGPLVDAFTRARPTLDVTVLTAQGADAAELLVDRRADVVLGPRITTPGMESIAFLRPRTVVVAAATHRLAHARSIPLHELAGEQWLEGPSAADPSTALAGLLTRARVAAGAPRVFPSHAAALAAAAAGEGLAAALVHTVQHELARGSLIRVDAQGTPAPSLWYASTLGAERRPAAATMLRRFITTPGATQSILTRSGGAPAARFRPSVYVTIWA